MAERLTRCSKCNSLKLTTVKVLNPDTTDLNMKAKLKCEDCGHENIYLVRSNHTNNLRKRGFII